MKPKKCTKEHSKVATLQFYLPEEKDEFTLACKGGDYYSALYEIDQYCRSELKYNDKVSHKTSEALQHIRDLIHESVDLYEIS